MLFYFFALLAAAAVVAAANPRSEPNRWAAAFLVFASIGGVADTLYEAGYRAAGHAVQLLNHTITPYGVLLFSIVYSESIRSKKARLYAKLLLLLPPAATILAASSGRQVFEIPYGLLLLWTAPYYLTACFLLLWALWREEDRKRRRSRLIVTVIIVPTVIAVLVFINVANIFIPDFQFFRYISFFILFSLTVALLGSFAIGVLGVKLRFERDPLEDAMKTASSGTTLLNHSIKNEIGKIALSSENLKYSLADSDAVSKQHLQIIANASDHLLQMAERMHSQTKELVLAKQRYRLDELADRCLLQHGSVFEQAGIVVSVDYVVRPTLLGDPLHVSEALGNVLMNAIEAMQDGGLLTIRLTAEKKSFRLIVQDTGEGVPPSTIAQVFQPFYSTKNRGSNFGLGLSYVYNVMRKSGGTAELTSVIGAGTSVALLFPAKLSGAEDGK
ncbi:sensor histidine kinase [Paenibacillus gorillae]|uniref:sensor histidine kinase n=1 Tax=Paenibacillus gorillae TaxID=1243662 RepID=UPI0004AF5AE7|nr:HAMP domain-containing sensor histidine kinase [Paenibacillus gorillae]